MSGRSGAGGSLRRRHGARIREWLGRYAPAEAAAVVGALLAATVAGWCGLATGAAFAGAIGEAVAFYAVLFYRDLRRSARASAVDPAGRPVGRAWWRTFRGLLTEFGPAELLDSFAVRPWAMYLAAVAVDSVMAGVIIGKIVADIVFYTLTIISYEVRKAADARGRSGQQALIAPVAFRSSSAVSDAVASTGMTAPPDTVMRTLCPATSLPRFSSR